MSMIDLVVGVIKPVGISSFGVISRARKILGVRKIGHAGTLDPLASGVLVLGIGKGTKRLESEVKKKKVYTAEITLGVTSSTGDEEGEKTKITVAKQPTDTQLSEILREFEGSIHQTPPVYSAIKIDGQEAYKRVRRGEQVTMRARKVIIYSIELVSYHWPVVILRVTTGPGVYIRTLAEDIGERLGTGGYLSGLVREAVGEFTLNTSISLDELRSWYDKVAGKAN